MIRFILLLSFLLSSPASGFAESRFTVEGDTLIFNIKHPEAGYEHTGYLEPNDSDLFASYIFENPQVKTLRVTGPGGYVPAARSIAEVLMKYEIDTVAYGQCMSACTLIFLGGKSRTMEPGAKLGFHKQLVAREDHKPYFEYYREEKGWADEYDYFEYSYSGLVDKLIEDIRYVTSRGVALDFILKAFSTDVGKMWTPTREELLSAGVVTR